MNDITIETPRYAGPLAIMPVMDHAMALSRREQMVSFVHQIMTPDVDFGIIPGTKSRTLLKPGAEKLCTFFGLSVRFVIIERIEDWSGADHGGEPFFYYLYRCQLWRGDAFVAEADGSCNSWESKYRYRDAKRKCPECGEAAIIKGKEDYGGGWLCFKKQGGCGMKFSDGDKRIEDQQTGKVLNDDTASLVNTIQKMSQKRAHVAAALIGVNASEFFSENLEDHVIDASPARAGGSPPRRAAGGRPARGRAPDQGEDEPHYSDQIEAFTDTNDGLTLCETIVATTTAYHRSGSLRKCMERMAELAKDGFDLQLVDAAYDTHRGAFVNGDKAAVSAARDAASARVKNAPIEGAGREA